MTGFAAIDRALDDLRTGLLLDGIELRLLRVADGVVEIAMRFSSDACADCIVPRPVLEQILLNSVREVDPSAKSLVLLDDDEELDSRSQPHSG